MEYIARKGDLYFNLHTTGQTYFGDIRGRIVAVSDCGDASPAVGAIEEEAPSEGDAATQVASHDGH
jgi:hypothetical protein